MQCALLDYSVTPTDETPFVQRVLVPYLLGVIAGSSGILPSFLRGFLGVLAFLYSVGLKIYLGFYRIRILKRHRLPVPVLCVGNLTSGGTGKTPMTQWLCRYLVERGYRVVVLNRGYRGANEYGTAVVSDEHKVLLGVTEAGDEAFLLASTLPGVPVIVGKDRRKSGALAVERFHPDVVVMDDGMQYWQLHKDVEIALLNSVAPFDNGWTLPRGLLREPADHLKRARFVVLTHANRISLQQTQDLRHRVATLAPDSMVLHSEVIPLEIRGMGVLTSGGLRAKESVGEDLLYDIDWLKGRSVVSLCGLGSPSGFEATLQDLGCLLAGRVRLPDHDRISDSIWNEIRDFASGLGAEAIVTTEKDGVKSVYLSSGSVVGEKSEGVPVLVLRISVALRPEDEFKSCLLKCIALYTDSAAL